MRYVNDMKKRCNKLPLDGAVCVARCGCLLVALTIVSFLIAACESDNPWHSNVPPEGFGALVVDNRTSDRLEVYLDGEEEMTVRGGRYQYIDFAPGSYRLVIMSSDGFRSYRDDIDIVKGRITVVELRGGGENREYNARIYFE